MLRNVALGHGRLWSFLTTPAEGFPACGHFPSRVARIATENCLQLYPDRHLGELAAETIAWRLHPGYGRSTDAPILPLCLENWVNECFPFLVNSQSLQTTTHSTPTPGSSGTLSSETSRAAVNLRFAHLTAERYYREVTDSFELETQGYLQAANGQLAAEMQRAVSDGYVKGFVLPDNRHSPHSAAGTRFWRLVYEYNLVMADFHRRFPDLRRVEPPYLSSNDPTHADSAGHRSLVRNAQYNVPLRILEFRQCSDASRWGHLINNDGTRHNAPSRGLAGLVAHEYGHHLSSDAVVGETRWMPQLKTMLEARLLAAEAGGPENRHAPPELAFRTRYGNLIGTMGIGYYASQSAGEFAAEAIAWRMHPDYGGKRESPRMPRFLEEWVHGCFPFLNNGQVPDPCCEVNQGALMMPVYRDGNITWKARTNQAVKGPSPV